MLVLLVRTHQQDALDVRLYRRRYIPELIMSLSTSPCAMSALTLSATAAAAQPSGHAHGPAGHGSAGAGTNVLQGMQGRQPGEGGASEGGVSGAPMVLNGAAAMGLALIARAVSVPGLARHLVHGAGEGRGMKAGCDDSNGTAIQLGCKCKAEQHTSQEGALQYNMLSATYQRSRQWVGVDMDEFFCKLPTWCYA
jgi:hypothetical protein